MYYQHRHKCTRIFLLHIMYCLFIILRLHCIVPDADCELMIDKLLFMFISHQWLSLITEVVAVINKKLCGQYDVKANKFPHLSVCLFPGGMVIVSAEVWQLLTTAATVLMNFPKRKA